MFDQRYDWTLPANCNLIMEAMQVLHELFQGTCYEIDKLRRTALLANAMAGQPVCRAMRSSGHPALHRFWAEPLPGR